MGIEKCPGETDMSCFVALRERGLCDASLLLTVFQLFFAHLQSCKVRLPLPPLSQSNFKASKSSEGPKVSQLLLRLYVTTNPMQLSPLVVTAYAKAICHHPFDATITPSCHNLCSGYPLSPVRCNYHP